MIDKGKTTQRLVTILPVCWGLSVNNSEGMWFFFWPALGRHESRRKTDLSQSWRILAEMEFCKHVRYLNSLACVFRVNRCLLPVSKQVTRRCYGQP